VAAATRETTEKVDDKERWGGVAFFAGMTESAELAGVSVSPAGGGGAAAGWICLCGVAGG